jgi:uncharacterized membrane protein YccC
LLLVGAAGATEVTGVIVTNPTSKYKSELRLVIRALTAAALSLVTANALDLPQGYWAVFTALIIVQGSVGGTLAAGLDRFVGTLAGAVLGDAVALTGEFWRVPQVLLLVLAVAPVALLAAIRPSFRIAPVTAAILLLTTPSNASPINSAVDRVVEIALGTIIGIGVSIFVLPSRARRICFERSAEMLKLLAQVLELHLQRLAAANLEGIEHLNQRARVELAKVEAAAEEARREHLIRVAEGPVPERLVRTLRRLRSDVAFVGRATAGDDFDWQALGLVTAELAGAFRLVFEALSDTLLHDAHPPDLTELDQTIAKLRIATSEDGNNPRSPHLAIALPFVIDTLRRDLGDLIDALVRPATS